MSGRTLKELLPRRSPVLPHAGHDDRGGRLPWRERLEVRVKRWRVRSPAVVRAVMGRLTVFRVLMAGSSISMLGSRISTVAFPMLVLDLNNSPFIAGLVTCGVVLPSMLMYLPAGALVDAWNPWRVMLISEITRGFVVAAVVSLLVMSHGHANIYLLLFFMITEEILEIFWMLADRRLMSHLMELERKRIDTGQASIEARSHTTVLAGRPIGPWLFAMNELYPFLADALSFVFSVVFLFLVGGRRVPKVPPRKRDLWGEIADGFGWLRENAGAGIVMGLMSFTTLVAQALIIMFLAQAHDRRLSTAAIGVVLAASGAGGAIGVAVGRKSPRWLKQYWLQIQLCVWSVALALLAIAGTHFFWCIAVVMLILGITGSISNIEFGAYLVRKAGDKLARVTSIGQVMVIGACGIGPFIGGTAIQWMSVRGSACFFLCLVLLGAALAFRMPRISAETAVDGLADGPAERVPAVAMRPAKAVVMPSVDVMGMAGRPGSSQPAPQVFGYPAELSSRENGRPLAIADK